LDAPPLPLLDIIFCRNVLIYLTREHVAEMEAALFDTLILDGWLVLGQSEAIHTQRERWITHVYPGAIAYQKAQEGHSLPITRHHQPMSIVEPAATNGSHPPKQLYAAAVEAVRADQPAEAEQLLAELLAEHPNHAQARTLLAYIFANRQAVPEAHAHLDAALQTNSMLGDAYYLRATLHLEAGQQNAAEQALRAALYCQRNHPLATFALGNLYAQNGDHLRASRAWESARELIHKLPPEMPVSDLSDMTAATFGTFIQTQLDSLEIERE
jgi:chemotaxis protein methyltransferase CheR